MTIHNPVCARKFGRKLVRVETGQILYCSNPKQFAFTVNEGLSLMEQLLCKHLPFVVLFPLWTETGGLVRAGVGFGVAEHSVKALQMALSQDSLGGGVDEDGRVPGYSISFNFKRNRSFGEVGHFYAGQRVGLWLGPDGPHERNHQGPCQAKYGGLTRCPQLAGVDCGVDVYGRSKKPKDTSGVSGMGLDALIFDVTLVNELDNADINRELCNLAVTRAIEHPHDRLHACCSEVWICGRCFCSSPLMRSFDKSGKLRLTRTWQER